MNVIINPSGKSGHSFKGLNAYLSHDQDFSPTSERVDWIESRNLANDDPVHAWKIMLATAYAQEDLKRAAGVKAGKPAKDGPVMHVVLAFDEDEPKSREEMLKAADEYLSTLGVDPAKMRAKNKPKRRQFADEHQVLMYAHNDTGKNHIHLMINKVHPVHGVLLPSNNEQRKASKWALDYSKRHGTDHKTPAREENLNALKAGKKFQSQKRKSRNAYERDKAASNDNDRLAVFNDQQRKKDAPLALRGRNMKALHQSARDKLVDAHKARVTALKDNLAKGISRAQTAAFEEMRIPRRELAARQQAEKQTFEALEKSFFGRLLSGAKLSASMLRNQESNIIRRAFSVTRNAAEREQYFESRQEAAQKALERQEAEKAAEAAKALKATQAGKLKALRALFLKDRAELLKRQGIEAKALKADWKTRTAERDAAMKKFEAEIHAEAKAQPEKKPDRIPTPRQQALIDKYAKDFEEAQQEPNKEQDNERERDRGDEDRER